MYDIKQVFFHHQTSIKADKNIYLSYSTGYKENVFLKLNTYISLQDTGFLFNFSIVLKVNISLITIIKILTMNVPLKTPIQVSFSSQVVIILF